MSYQACRQVALIIVAVLTIAFSGYGVLGQEAAWEGLINAGRNALQQKNFSEAERHFESALEAAESFPSGDARLGKSYNNLAAVYYAQEDYARAEPLMRRALTQLQEALGPDNTEVAQTMKNLAALYYLQGNREEAEQLLKTSLATLEKIHGPNHAFVATVLSNLAGLYQAENRYEDAEPLLTRSLEIWEGLLGSDHPDVARSRSLLAQVRQARGSDQESQAADVSPKPLTSLATNDEDGKTVSDKEEEIARAAAALDQLTRVSRAQADRAQADGVPAPALNPIANALVDDEVDAAIAPGDDSADQSSTTGQVDDRTADETPTTGPEQADTGSDQAAAILDEAGSVDDVSFAVYLSTLWSVDEARRYWRSLQDAVPEILADKRMEIEEVAAAQGADPFYRVLTAPFSSDPEAQAACERIRSTLRTHDCSVVVRDAAEATAGG